MNDFNYDDKKSVPYLVFEDCQVKNERHIKRLIIALIISILLMFASNMAWLYAWQSYDYESEETAVIVDSKDGGNANYIGNDGDITNGENSGRYKAAGTP